MRYVGKDDLNYVCIQNRQVATNEQLSSTSLQGLIIKAEA